MKKHIKIGVLILCATAALCWATVLTAHHRRIASAYECLANLRRIESATYMWAFEFIDRTNRGFSPASWPSYKFANYLQTNPLGRVAPTVEDINVYLSGDEKLPHCPDGGTYTIGPLSDAPTCSIPGHDFDHGPVGVSVEDDQGHEIRWATVVATDQSGRHWSARTDQNGLAVLKAWPNKIVSVQVSKDGYITYTNSSTGPAKPILGAEIRLRKKS